MRTEIITKRSNEQQLQEKRINIILDQCNFMSNTPRQRQTIKMFLKSNNNDVVSTIMELQRLNRALRAVRPPLRSLLNIHTLSALPIVPSLTEIMNNYRRTHLNDTNNL